MSSGSGMMIAVGIFTIAVVVLILRSEAVRDYFKASTNSSSSADQPVNLTTNVADQQDTKAGLVEIHEGQTVLPDANGSRTKRVLLSPGPDPHDLGSGGSRVEVRGTSHWIKKHEMPGPDVTFFVLVREPNNKHDRNAIAVYGGGRKVGYVSAKRAEVYGPLLDACDMTRVLVAREEGKGLFFRLPSLGVVRKLAQQKR